MKREIAGRMRREKDRSNMKGEKGNLLAENVISVALANHGK